MPPPDFRGAEIRPGAVSITSHGSLMRARVFAAEQDGPRPALLLMPGWPGSTDDVLGLGAALSVAGITVLTVTQRGMHESEGTTTFANTLDDIGSALDWFRSPDVVRRYRLDVSRVALGGHSHGGGMALAHAARDPQVHRLIAIAATDYAELTRARHRDTTFAALLDNVLRSTQAPAGPVRFDIEACYRELAEGQATFGLRENAARLADRSILLVGGWEDVNTPIEQHLLPFYRALRRAGASDVTFFVHHDDHGFGRVRDRLASDLTAWIAGDRRRYGVGSAEER